MTGAELRAWRERRGLTIEQASEIFGLSHGNDIIRMEETHWQNPPGPICKLIEALDTITLLDKEIARKNSHIKSLNWFLRIGNDMLRRALTPDAGNA